MKSKKLFPAKFQKVAYSNIVGQSLTVEMDGIGCVAVVHIMVPQTRLDYRTVAESVADALTRHLDRGAATLVLPEDFMKAAPLPLPTPPAGEG